MQFYSELNLRDSNVLHPRGWEGWLVAPEIKLKDVGNLKFTVQTPFEGSAHVFLMGIKKSTYISRTLGQISLSTIPSNCGTIQINNLLSYYPRQGIGTGIMRAILNFARQAGYSMIIFNTAGPEQNELAGKQFFEKIFKAEVITTFKNIRSGNMNVFYRILLQE